MNTLNMYGKAIRNYSAQGILSLANGNNFNCVFKAMQLADGKIIVECNLGEESLPLFNNRQEKITKITGTTENGDSIEIEGQLFWTKFDITTTTEASKSVTNINIIVYASNMNFKTKYLNKIRMLKFGITNFNYVGNKTRFKSNGGMDIGILEITLPQGTIQVHQIDGYSEIIKLIEAQKGIEVTCEAIVDLSLFDSENNAIEVVNNICLLLSFCRGTKINWIYYDCYDETGKILISKHLNSLNERYTPLPLIDPRNTRDTSIFVEKIYKQFIENEVTYGLRNAIEAYLNAKREVGYLETRALSAIVTIEYLNSKHSKLKNNSNIVNDKDFAKIRSQISDLLANIFREKTLDTAILENMILKIPELQRKPFETTLKALLDDIRLKIEGENLKTFIKIRNSLVHNLAFRNDIHLDSVQQYLFIIGFLDKTILKILSYSGEIIDISNNHKILTI